MLKNDNQRERYNMVSDYALRIFRLLFFINVLSFSSLSVSAGEPPDINKIVTPAAVTDVVAIHPFALEEGYRYDWRQERPFIESGTLVVFKVNPDLVYPRNAAEPVLYAGNQTAQRLNHGHESGFVIAIIPGEVDLAREPAWFGSPALPERVNAETINSERAKAEKAGIRPFDAEKIRSVTQERLEASDLASLLREHVAELLVKYSPQEKALAETWRLPVAQR
jgi:hypothetical protein